MSMPTNTREARRWVRLHWADLINQADMGGVGDMECDAIDAIWGDECVKIAARLKKSATSRSQHEGPSS